TPGTGGAPGTGGSGTGGAAGAGGTGTGGQVTCPAGTMRCPCYGNNTCNADLTCVSDVCVTLPPGTGGSGSGRSPGTGGSAGTGGAGTGGAGTGGAGGGG